MKYSLRFNSVLLTALCLLSVPFLVLAENPTVEVNTDKNTVSMTYDNDINHFSVSTIDFPEDTGDLQALSIKQDNKFYIAVLVQREHKVRLQLYTDTAEKISSKLVFDLKKKRHFDNTQLSVVNTGESVLYRVRGIVLKQKGKPLALLTKEYEIRPTNDKPFTRNSAKREKIEFPEFDSALSSEEEGLAMMNYQRMASGVLPVARDATLDSGCEKHVEYMRLNEEITHFEDESKPGYTKEGAEAGMSSDLAALYKDNSMRPHIEVWIEAIYHRLPMLAKGLKKVGWGVSAESKQAFNYSCLDVFGGKEYGGLHGSGERTNVPYWIPENHKPIPYPGVGQENVPTRFDSGESPDPIAAFGASYPVGQPISLIFSDDDEVSEMSMTLRDSAGNTAGGYFRAPDDESDPNKEYQGNMVSFIAKSALKSDETYTVTVTGKRNGNDYSKTWKFHTAPPQFDSSKHN